MRMPGRADGGDLGDSGAARLRRPSPTIASTVRRIGSALELPVSSQALAEPRHLGAVGDRPPAPSVRALADVELDRVRADVDHGEADGTEADQRLEPARHADVRAVGELELAHARRARRAGPPTRRRASASSGRRAVSSDSSAMHAADR